MRTPPTHTHPVENKGEGTAWCCPDEGLGAKGTGHIKRGKQRWGGSLQAATLVISKAARHLQRRTALAIQPGAVDD